MKPIPQLAMPNWQSLQQIPIVADNQRLHPLSLAPPPLKIYPAYYHLGISGALSECYVRTDVYHRLLAVAQALPQGMQLVVLDAWRPLAVQKRLFETLLEVLQQSEPQTDTEQLVTRARNLVSPPCGDPAAPSPHFTGGAVDVTLADAQGLMLDMGTAFDEASERSASASFEKALSSDSEGRAARDNRRILYWAMIEAGFTNLPSEWWHFDYGDQLWAWYANEPQAFYSGIEPQSLPAQWREQIAAEKI